MAPGRSAATGRRLAADRRPPQRPRRRAPDAGASAASPRGPPSPDDAAPDGTGTDDRLALLFACCHPALAPEARLALTLRAVVGLTTPQIARAFLVNETTLAQRIVRAKRKIVTAGISLAVPEPGRAHRAARRRARRGLRDVQRGLRRPPRGRPRTATSPPTRSGSPRSSRPVCPTEADAWGLAALLSFQHARAAARFGAAETWSCSPTRTAPAGTPSASPSRTTTSTGPRRCAGPARYQLQAAIAACHASSPTGPRPTGCRSSPCTTSCWPTNPPPSPGSTGPSPWRSSVRTRRPGAGRRRRPGRRARRLPPLPRHPRRAARARRPPRRGRGRQPAGARAHHQRRRAQTPGHPPAPAPPHRRHLVT